MQKWRAGRHSAGGRGYGMRMFVAIELPEAACNAVHALGLKLRREKDGASWVRPENMHLTLRFYGDVPDAQTRPLIESLCRRISPLRWPVLLTRGIGAFPSVRRPSILWAGLETLSGDLDALQQAAEAAASDIGLPPETRAFHPHVTIARVRVQDKTGAYAALLAPYLEPGATPEFGQAFEVRNVVLFSSQLTPRGPVYKVVREIPLHE